MSHTEPHLTFCCIQMRNPFFPKPRICWPTGPFVVIPHVFPSLLLCWAAIQSFLRSSIKNAWNCVFCRQGLRWIECFPQVGEERKSCTEQYQIHCALYLTARTAIICLMLSRAPGSLQLCGSEEWVPWSGAWALAQPAAKCLDSLAAHCCLSQWLMLFSLIHLALKITKQTGVFRSSCWMQI